MTQIGSWSTSALLCSALALLGCDSERQVGSACPGGACETRAALDGEACLIGEVSFEVATESLEVPGLCLPRALPRNEDGLVGCTLLWALPSDAPAAGCDAFEFAGPVGDQDALGRQRCAVRQLPVVDGSVVAGPNSGWYYDDFSEDLSECLDGRQRVAASAGVTPPPGTTMELRCVSALTAGVEPNEDLQSVPEDVCAAPDNGDSDFVGLPCRPSLVPDGGFDDREAYLEVGASACPTNACLVFRLRGDTREDCDPAATTCVSADELRDRAYCSCRCEVGAGAEDMADDTCACPEGFACLPLFEQSGPETRGGYCVREGTFTL